jgi:hypothetical protein
MVWGAEPASPLSRSSHGVKTGTIAVWRRKQIPLHTSWRVGSSGTLFFRFGVERGHQEPDRQVDELHLRGAIVAEMKKRDCDHVSQSLFLFLQSFLPELYLNLPALRGF